MIAFKVHISDSYGTPQVSAPVFRMYEGDAVCEERRTRLAPNDSFEGNKNPMMGMMGGMGKTGGNMNQMEMQQQMMMQQMMMMQQSKFFYPFF